MASLVRKLVTFTEDTPAVCMSRVVGTDNTVVAQADISTITCAVYDLSGATPDTAVISPAQVVADTVFDTLQTDARWTEDSTGYNFRSTVAATGFPTGNHRYRVEFKFTDTSANVFWAIFEGPATALRTS